jgi:hypothetical protein
MRGFVRLTPVLAIAAVASAGAATTPHVAFERAGNSYEIVRLDQNGSNLVELTRGHPEPTISEAFSWSPDGTRLVYAERGIVGGDLYALDADGTTAIRLTSGGGNQFPAWSPDGRWIAYVHTVRVPQPGGLFRLDEDVWLVAPDGHGAHALTNDKTAKRRPAWSPDSKRILYGGSGTSIVDAATGRRLLHTNDGGGAWSPDGSRIAVVTGRGIDVIGTDGSGRRKVARSGAGGPEWSPDGSRIAFERSHCTLGVKGLCGTILHAVYTVGADGSGERRLTGPIGGGPGSTVEGFPNDDGELQAWWPDGSQLFFTFAGRMYAMNADGSCQRPFGPANLLLRDPAWQPGAKPSVPPLRCADLRVRATPVRNLVGLRGDARVRLSIENDGNETATGVELTLKLAFGRGQVRPPPRSCRGERVIVCELAPVAAGRTTQLTVSVAAPRSPGFQLRASVTGAEHDSDPATNTTLAGVTVLDCDIVGTARSDRLGGTSGRDSICALAGGDVIHAGAGRDRIEGGSGADSIYARDGERDTIDCGAGRDTVRADRIDKLTRCERVVR